MKKKPMPKGESLRSNSVKAAPSPIGKTQMPAARKALGGKKTAGKGC